MERRISSVTEQSQTFREEISSKVLTPAQAQQAYEEAENYLYGWNGYTKDKNRAVQLYREAATNGNVIAQYRLACCYENGDGVQQDLNSAKKWYATAAANGHSGSELKLAKLGGSSYDSKDAQDLYQRGNEYFYGWNGRAVDKEIARQLYVKAANLGHVGAHNQLAKHFS
ncbi:MAG: sel1 repeat family protein [Selenomonadaceae bacterium]|nr:sel1 repeat family protein [Selenomonadaceae bacterium]